MNWWAMPTLGFVVYYLGLLVYYVMPFKTSPTSRGDENTQL